MIYLSTFRVVDFYGKCRYINIPSMDAMGANWKTKPLSFHQKIHCCKSGSAFFPAHADLNLLRSRCMVSTSVVSLVGCVFGADFLHDPTWLFPKIGGFPPKMDDLIIMENPMNKWDDLGVPKPPKFWFNTHINMQLGISGFLPKDWWCHLCHDFCCWGSHGKTSQGWVKDKGE